VASLALVGQQVDQDRGFPIAELIGVVVFVQRVGKDSSLSNMSSSLFVRWMEGDLLSFFIKGWRIFFTVPAKFLQFFGTYSTKGTEVILILI